MSSLLSVSTASATSLHDGQVTPHSFVPLTINNNWIFQRRHLQGHGASSCEPLRRPSLLHTLVFRDWLQCKARGMVILKSSSRTRLLTLRPLQPIPSCISLDRPPRYEVITAGEYVKSRLHATYNHWEYIFDEVESKSHLPNTHSCYMNINC